MPKILVPDLRLEVTSLLEWPEAACAVLQRFALEELVTSFPGVTPGGRAARKAAGSIARRTAKPLVYSLFFGYGCYHMGKGTLKAIEQRGGGQVIRNGRILLKRDPRFALGMAALACGVAITAKFEEVVKAAR